jgi:hypothetical protein
LRRCARRTNPGLGGAQESASLVRKKRFSAASQALVQETTRREGRGGDDVTVFCVDICDNNSSPGGTWIAAAVPPLATPRALMWCPSEGEDPPGLVKALGRVKPGAAPALPQVGDEVVVRGGGRVRVLAKEGPVLLVDGGTNQWITAAECEPVPAPRQAAMPASHSAEDEEDRQLAQALQQSLEVTQRQLVEVSGARLARSRRGGKQGGHSRGKPQLKSAEEQLKPAEEQLKPVEEQLKPVEKQLKPAEKQLKAVEKQLKAAEKQLKPAEKQLKPAEKQLKPAEKQLKPAEEQQAPKPLAALGPPAPLASRAAVVPRPPRGRGPRNPPTPAAAVNGAPQPVQPPALPAAAAAAARINGGAPVAAAPPALRALKPWVPPTIPAQLYVSGFPPQWADADMKRYFEQFAPVAMARITSGTDKRPPLGFVAFDNREDEKLLAELCRLHMVDALKVTVKRALPLKSPRRHDPPAPPP